LQRQYLYGSRFCATVLVTVRNPAAAVLADRRWDWQRQMAISPRH
jgi:hypothetical protein